MLNLLQEYLNIDYIENTGHESLNMKFPKTLYKQLIYIIMVPITIPLYYTLPNVKKKVYFF